MTSKRGKSCSGRPKRQDIATKSDGRLRPDSRKKTGAIRSRAGIGGRTDFRLPADRPFRHRHRCRTQGIRHGGRIAAEYDPFGYSVPVVEHRDKTRSRMRRERCPARRPSRGIIPRGRRHRPSHGHPAGRRPTVALGPPTRNPLASERFSDNRPSSGRPSDKTYQQESLAENQSAERNHTRQRGAPGKQARRHRQDKCGSQAEPRSKNRRTAQERSVRRGSLRQPATDNRNPTVADRYPIGPAPPFYAPSSKFRFPRQIGRLVRPGGQTKKPTRFASAHRTAYRNRTSICRLRIYRPNR